MSSLLMLRGDVLAPGDLIFKERLIWCLCATVFK